MNVLGVKKLNDYKEWPENYPDYIQECYSSRSSRCTMLVGPCNCGAWHLEGEFELKKEGLYRYGVLVVKNEQN